MIICGIKLTHDGAISLIENNRLIFSYEMEKLNNNNRFSALDVLTLEEFRDILAEYGYTFKDIDKVVIDGWGEYGGATEQNNETYTAKMTSFSGEEFFGKVAQYGLNVKEEDVLETKYFSYPEFNFSYSSYMHVSSHIFSAYCTSPFSKNNENSFALVWDGAMCPQLFYVRGDKRKVKNLGSLFIISGNIYGTFANNFPPFNNFSFADGSIAGKVMAYIAKGECKENVLNTFKSLFKTHNEKYAPDSSIPNLEIAKITNELMMDFVKYGESINEEPVNLMASFHVFINDILLESLKEKIKKYPDYNKKLCYAGGCALNIKWNSTIRNSNIFEEIWIPPFPNDSGSAVGTACCEMFKSSDFTALDWDVYSGPNVLKEEFSNNNWVKYPFSIKKMAQVLYELIEPIVFINGRAELGPRALGNRSILASAVSNSMKDKLNEVKNREDYRPVAPICLQDRANEIFFPGIPDPLMLFDHQVKEEWKDKIPAVCHIDGTARLQTITRNSNPVVYELIEEYSKLSQIPVLCNTSANYKGKGFFPNVSSVMEWDKVNMIWSDNFIYVKIGTLAQNRVQELCSIENVEQDIIDINFDY